MPTPYDVLGVASNATDEEIQHAYRIRARLVHPDRHQDAGDDVRAAAEAEFRKVADAYQQIRRSRRRPRTDHVTASTDRDPADGNEDRDAEALIVNGVITACRARLGEEPIEGTTAYELASLVIGVATSQLERAAARVRGRDDFEGAAAHEALCLALDELAASLLAANAGRGAFDAGNRLIYEITYGTCKFVAEVAELHPGLRPPIPLAERLHQDASSPISRDRVGGRAPTPPCVVCGSGPTSRYKFYEIRGRVVFWQSRTVDESLCRDCALALGRDMQAATLVHGWWGILSVVFTVGATLSNAAALRRAAREPGAVPGPTSVAPPLEPGEPVFRRPGPWIATGIATVIAIVLVAIGTVSADPSASTGAGSVRSTGTRGSHSESGATWAVGRCVSGSVLVEPISCSEPHTGRITSSVSEPGDCPTSADSYVRDGSRVWCIDEDR